MPNIAILYTTMASTSEAEKMASEAVREKYAACVNIIPQGISVYAWEGKIEKSAECFMLFKTTPARVQALSTWLKTVHPYSTPAMLHSEIETSEDYFQYVQDIVTSAS